MVKEKEVEVGTIRDSIGLIESSIRKIFEKDFISHDIPDRMPRDWCKSALRVNIPMDMMDIVHIDTALNKLKELIIERKGLRKKEADLMLSIGTLKIQETVPD